MVRYLQTAGAFALVLLASACASANGSAVGQPSDLAARTYMLHGTLVTVGGPAPGTTQPAAGSVSIFSGTKLVAVVQVQGGTFTHDLPEGRYTLNGEHGGAPCRAVAVTITAGTAATAEVVCDVP
jgi:hypothetical protein